jgi:S-adenosylmethionine:tRNA ribosyltransferase-isomerase
MHLSQFDYHLPPELIAQTPIEPRHAARLMVINRQTSEISHHTFADIVNFLRPDDLMIANNSRVLPARLYGRKSTGGQVEILLLKPQDVTKWEVLVGGKRLHPGVIVEISQQPPLSLTILADLGEARRLVEFSQPLENVLDEVGHVPLPPYIQTRLEDAERYQTVFSRITGSTAAPTAGLHFSPELLLELRQHGISLDYVTLHIGLDTFKPVTVEQIEQHVIHRELATLSSETAQRINQTKLAGGRVVAIGTTSVRTLETAALRATGYTESLKTASQLVVNQCGWQTVVAINEETDLYIYPGYTFRAVDIMVTNFHLPKSTLLMLVSAFAGTELIKHAYEVAVAEKYRFFSFGDAILIL